MISNYVVKPHDLYRDHLVCLLNGFSCVTGFGLDLSRQLLFLYQVMVALSQLYGVGNSLAHHNCKSIHCLCAFTYFGFVHQNIPKVGTLSALSSCYIYIGFHWITFHSTVYKVACNGVCSIEVSVTARLRSCLFDCSLMNFHV